LGDIAEFNKGSGYSKGDLVESGTPIILYGRLYTKYETSISEVDTYVKAKDGSVYSKGGEVIVPASGETAEDIARAATVDKSGVILGGDLNVVSPNEDINSAFLAISISHGNSQRQLAKKAQGKSVVHIHNEEIKNLVVPFPANAEQNKIVEYFSNLDHLITLHQRKYFIIYNKLITWEQRKLGEVLKERTERAKGDEELLSVTIANGVIRQIDSEKRNTASEDRSNYKIVKKGDVPYNSMRMWQGAVGNSKYNGIVSPAYTILTPTSEANGKFFMELFKKKSTLQIFQRWSQGLTSDTWNLKYPILSSIQFAIPSVEEQEKIAEYFSSLDYLITLHRRAL
jgi:type I restriction enzyme S subunit